jgi:peroxiredoxin
MLHFTSVALALTALGLSAPTDGQSSASLHGSVTPATTAPLGERAALKDLNARFGSIEKTFRGRRSALDYAGHPLTIELEPAWLRAEFRPAMESLAELGCGRASAWLLRHFHSDVGESAAAIVARKVALYREVLARNAGADWIDSNEIDVVRALMLDGPELGVRFVREFGDALLDANPHRLERRAAILRAMARTVVAAGEHRDSAYQQAAHLWRNAGVGDGPESNTYLANEVWQLEHLRVGRVAPNFCATDVDGNQIELEGFRNRVVVVAFFKLSSRADTAWAERVRQLYATHEEEPFAVIGVEMGTNEAVFRRLVEEQGLRFPCVFEGAQAGRVASTWRLNEAPRSFVFDTSGRLRFVDLDGAALESAVETLLQEPPARAAGVHGRQPTRR